MNDIKQSRIVYMVESLVNLVGLRQEGWMFPQPFDSLQTAVLRFPIAAPEPPELQRNVLDVEEGRGCPRMPMSPFSAPLPAPTHQRASARYLRRSWAVQKWAVGLSYLIDAWRQPVIGWRCDNGRLFDPADAHGGGLDRRGGHFDRCTGEYHCHRVPCEAEIKGKAPNEICNQGHGRATCAPPEERRRSPTTQAGRPPQ